MRRTCGISAIITTDYVKKIIVNVLNVRLEVARYANMNRNEVQFILTVAVFLIILWLIIISVA